MGNAVANKKSAELSTDVMDDIFATAGEGASFDSSEMQIPFVRLLQAMSPQLNKRNAEYIEGSQQGDAFNNVTFQIWEGEKGIQVIPCYQCTKYLEFVPRDLGGGFKGEIAATDPVLTKTTRSGSKEMLPNGNELVKSDQHFVLIVEEDGSYQPAVVDMKSTALKVSRRWKTQIAMQKVKHPKSGAMVTPAVFATIWRLRSVEESNDQGTWNNWAIEKVGLVKEKDQLQEAMLFRQSVAAGEVKAAPEVETSKPASAERDDEIPF